MTDPSEIKVMAPEDLEGDEEITLVCMRSEGFESPFADDKRAPCALCGEELVHRPHAPEPSRKICNVCAEPELEAARARGEQVEKFATPQSIMDLVMLMLSGPRQ